MMMMTMRTTFYIGKDMTILFSRWITESSGRKGGCTCICKTHDGTPLLMMHAHMTLAHAHARFRALCCDVGYVHFGNSVRSTPRFARVPLRQIKIHVQQRALLAAGWSAHREWNHSDRLSERPRVPTKVIFPCMYLFFIACKLNSDLKLVLPTTVWD